MDKEQNLIARELEKVFGFPNGTINQMGLNCFMVDKETSLKNPNANAFNITQFAGIKAQAEKMMADESLLELKNQFDSVRNASKIKEENVKKVRAQILII